MDENKETKPEGVDEFSRLMEEYDHRSLDYHTPVDGQVIEIRGDKVILDIGGKTEGALDLAEVTDWTGQVTCKPGDVLRVLCKALNRKEGHIVVSKRELDAAEHWDRIKELFDRNEPVEGKIVRVMENGKGYIVDVGVSMFLPMSQADIRRVKKPETMVGVTGEFRITRLNPRDQSGVVSRRVLMEEARDAKLQEVFGTLQVGQVVKGVVSTITDYGAFVNLGGVDGLVHRENISYGRITHPRERLQKGQEVHAMVLDINQEKKKISLGIKQLYPDPWDDVEDKYPVGHRLVAKVTKIVDFGAFIELEEGVEGLLHISDLTWEGKPKKVEEYVAVGDELWVQVIELNRDEKRIKLGLKQLELRPEEKYIEGHKAGEIIRVKVKKILKSRVFCEIAPGVEGVLKISDISYFRIESPKEFFSEGEEIEAMILDDRLDENYKVRLSTKHLTDNEWHDFFQDHRPGTIIPVKIKKVGDRGINVEITRNIEGFVKISEISEDHIEPEQLEGMFASGESREALITHAYPDKKRVYLSFKQVSEQREREEIEKYASSGHEGVTTIGDLFENAIDRRK